MANIPDNRFIAATSLEEYFVDKDSGLPLAYGAVYFYQDISRTTFKPVYELAGDPTSTGGYTFAQLPNPLILSQAGTFVDNNNNNIAVYYFPYDGTPSNSTGLLDLYYISVVDSFGNVQFTRSAWPSIAEDLVTEGSSAICENQISNPQFVDVSFDSSAAVTYSFAGAGSFDFQIAPDWVLEVVATGAGTVTVTRTAVAGGPPVATNPSYKMNIVPGANITTVGVRQRLSGNPGIWSPTTAGSGGFISGSILLYPNSQATMIYRPSTGVATEILSSNNASSAPAVYNNTIQLPASTNGSSAPAGYVDIYLQIPNTGAGTTFSSVQVVGLPSDEANVQYVQEPVARQVDHLFHYYNDPLQFKPIRSYLTGWDFSLNPAQFGTSGNISGTINKSAYAWDQTIIYAADVAGINYSAATNTNVLRVTAIADTQFAIVQYVDQETARRILNNDLSVNISASTNIVGGIKGTASLWYTTAASLPNAGPTGGSPNQSIVQTLFADGAVNATFGTGWTEIKRSLAGNLDGTFTVNQVTVDENFFNSPLTGWASNATAATTATYFAIVIGFATLPATNYVDFNSVSLVPGRIPTIPAPQTLQEVLRDCQSYWWSSYPVGTPAGSGWAAAGWLSSKATFAVFGASGTGEAIASLSISYPVSMRVAPTLTLYSPASGAAGKLAAVYNNFGTITVADPNVDVATYWTTATTFAGPTMTKNGYIGLTDAYYCLNGTLSIATAAPATYLDAYMAYHVVAEARLGII